MTRVKGQCSSLWRSWIGSWLTDRIGLRYASAESAYYSSRVMAFAAYVRLDPDEVTPEDVSAWLSRKHAPAGSVHDDRKILESFFGWVADTMLRDNPMPFVPEARRERFRPTASEDDMEHGRTHWDVRSRMMVVLAGDMGLRRGEIARLRGEDLTRFDDGGWGLRIHGEGSRERIVPVAEPLAHAILVRGSGFTFPGERGRAHVCEDTVNRIIHEATGCSPTALRRRFAQVSLSQTGGNPLVVAELMGQSVESVLSLALVRDVHNSGNAVIRAMNGR
ncbi:tyrosine-type recombinase/integrase [Bifidobacterium miconisargentati]|uniref:tyrosine-type recombinase/integrase n=1 Tax=Bifidobacterium miconisargentati TaxID=2834437 RepID=UPI001BDC8333|nr:site-specific integrase [Bifidobacterium miconisargentati]MBW3090104.1 hypothetical protein [Bifidobacterium miconisargentati]